MPQIPLQNSSQATDFRFNGSMGKGYMRIRRAQKRDEAFSRNASFVDRVAKTAATNNISYREAHRWCRLSDYVKRVKATREKEMN